MKYNRTFNFSAGPAMMPEPVLEEIRDEMMNYRGSGMCVMEMSHRSKVFQQIADGAEADLRALMGIGKEAVSNDFQSFIHLRIVEIKLFLDSFDQLFIERVSKVRTNTKFRIPTAAGQPPPNIVRNQFTKSSTIVHNIPK